MIDRYSIFSEFQDINKRYGLAEREEFTIPNYNAAPSQQLPVISNLDNKQISFFNWGIGSEWSNNKPISAKLLSVSVEQMKSKNTLRGILTKRRCLVPANGFYYWKQYGKKRRTPHYFYFPDQEIFSLAAIWEEFDDINGGTSLTFKFIERPNYSGITEFGEVMPAIIAQDNEKKWLDDYSSEEELFQMLEDPECIKKLTNHPVSPHITNRKLNRKELIEPQAQVDQLGNYTLFD